MNFGRYIVLLDTHTHTHTHAHHCMIRFRCCFALLSICLCPVSVKQLSQNLYHIWNLHPPGVCSTYIPWSSSYLLSYKSLKVLTSTFKHALHLLTIFRCCLCKMFFTQLLVTFLLQCLLCEVLQMNIPVQWNTFIMCSDSSVWVTQHKIVVLILQCTYIKRIGQYSTN